MTNRKNFLIGYKLIFGLLGFSAIVTEIATIIERGYFNPFNFFSFFTIQSSMLVAAILLLSAVATACGKNEKLDSLRGATTVYILIVGLGFSFLLAGLKDATFTAVAWDNIVLHYIMPLAVLIDLVIDLPKRKIAFKKAVFWLLYPIVYLVYTFTRGAITGWYPYPFLNPDNGYDTLLLAVLGIVIMATALTGVVSKLSGHKDIKAVFS